jgi:hypothetical protein
VNKAKYAEIRIQLIQELHEKMFSEKSIIFLIVFYSFNEIKAHEETLGYCAPYNGKICKSYIKSNQVYYSQTGGWENENIATGIFAGN